MDTQDNPKQLLADKLKDANYVLVTVGRNPSVDQLASLIGLTLLLNKAGKHAAAVFSGEVPSTLEFLKPEDTIEQTTDSLRDFIIALDKSKADKLRYKVEDDVVRIFITPYKTSITKDDLEFSQGDFNVDVVVALGVTKQEDLDEAIVSHGRILHDATVATVNISAEGDLGSIHWQESQASSLCEMMTDLARMLGSELVDNQIATAFLTGIVAETDRFSNDKTSAAVMSASAVLMAAGANQQLVASQLGQPQGASEEQSDDQPADQTESDAVDTAADEPVDDGQSETQPDDAALEIHHDQTPSNDENATTAESDEKTDDGYFQLPDPADSSDEADKNTTAEPIVDQPIEHLSGGSKLITEPPTLGGQLTANSQVEALEPSGDPLGAATGNHQDELLTRAEPLPALPNPVVAEPLPPTAPTQPPTAPTQPPAGPTTMITGLTPPPPAWVTPLDNPLDLPEAPAAPQSLTDLESAVHQPAAPLDAARDEVMQALNSNPTPPLPPVEALNAQPMMDNLNNSASEPPLVIPDQALPNNIPSLPLPTSTPAPAFDPASFGITSAPGAAIPGTPAPATDPNAAPPVPPPIPFNFGPPPAPPTA